MESYSRDAHKQNEWRKVIENAYSKVLMDGEGEEMNWKLIEVTMVTERWHDHSGKPRKLKWQR